MKNFLAGILATISLTLGNLLGHKSLPLPQVAISDQPSNILTAPSPSTSKLGSVGNALGKAASVLGAQTVKTGQTLLDNVTSTPSSSGDVIDMASVVHDISNRVESIPGNLVNQAKIEYCKQVLAAATASATKK